MNKVLNSFLKLSVFILAAAVMASFGDSASAQPCSVTVCKSAPGAGMQGFLIDFTDSGQTDTVELFDDSDCFTTQLNFDADVDITEQPTPGWVLQDVECEDNPGFDTTFIPGGVTVLCTSETIAETTCTFINVPGAAGNIPTLSEWGMIAAVAGLGLVGVFFAYKRRKAQAV
jgi:hypothetical protein